MFHTIANRYDLITLFSYGQDRRWKQRLVRLADVKPGERSLDLASGTVTLPLPSPIVDVAVHRAFGGFMAIHE